LALSRQEHSAVRHRASGGYLPIRYRPRDLCAYPRLPCTRTRQPVYHRREFFSLDRRSEPDTHDHRQRTPRRRHHQGPAMTTAAIAALLRRYGLVLLFLLFSALDKIFGFNHAVRQARQMFNARPVAIAMILCGLAIEIIWTRGVVSGI